MNGTEVVCVLANEWMTYGKGYTADVEQLYPANLLECPQPTFLRYRFIVLLLIGYKEGMMSYHYYFNNTGSTVCTGIM